MGPGRIVTGSTDQFELRILSESGELVQIIRGLWPNPPASPAVVERWVRARLVTAPDAASRRDLRRRYDALDFPSDLPAFVRLAVDETNRIWVQWFELDSEGSDRAKWTVFGTDGSPIAHVDIPRNFTPLHIGSGSLLGVWSDPLDVESIRLYRIRRRGPPPA